MSSGAVDQAKTNLHQMLVLCSKPLNEEIKSEDLVSVQKKSLYDVTHELVRQVTSPNTLVREQVRMKRWESGGGVGVGKDGGMGGSRYGWRDWELRAVFSFYF